MNLLSCAFSENPLDPIDIAFSLMLQWKPLITRKRLAATEEILAMFNGELCELGPGDVEDRSGVSWPVGISVWRVLGFCNLEVVAFKFCVSVRNPYPVWAVSSLRLICSF